MRKNSILLTLSLMLLLPLSAQTTSPLLTGTIIGTTISVDYDNNNQMSDTVNTVVNLFDGNLQTYFAAYQHSGGWAGLDLGQKHVITRVGFCPRQGWEERLQLGVFEGANLPDFGDAVPLFIIPQTPTGNVLTYQDIDNSRGFRYVRYVGPNDVRCNIAELQFYGYAGAGDDSHVLPITNIPDVVIHTTNAQDITSKEIYIKGIVSFVSAAGVYTDSLEIRGHGNASWGFDKKPYRLKLFTASYILGQPAKGKNWTLISNEGDKTLMRNLLAFDFSQRVEMPYTPAGIPVNVFLNGEYKGCYQFCDRIDVRENRVDIKEMKPTDISGNALTGGYLIELDAYAHDESPSHYFDSQQNGIPVTLHSPDPDDIVSQQRSYITSHFNQWESSVYASNYTDPINGFRKYMDTQTFARHFLVGEFSGNIDTYWSVYMYKKRGDDKFYWGPVWDFDLAYLNDSRVWDELHNGGTSDWLFRSGGSAANGVSSVINKLLTDANLYQEIKDTYAFYRNNGTITEAALMAVVDNYAAEIYDSQELNFKRWNYRNEWRHQMWGRSTTYQGDVDIVKDFIRKRLIWMDNKLNYVPAATENTEFANVTIFSDQNSLTINNLPENAEIAVYDISGRLISATQTATEYHLNLSKGVYLVDIKSTSGNSHVFKCVVK